MREKKQHAYFHCKPIYSHAAVKRITDVTSATSPSAAAPSLPMAEFPLWRAPMASFTLRRYGSTAAQLESQNSATNPHGDHPIDCRTKTSNILTWPW